MLQFIHSHETWSRFFDGYWGSQAIAVAALICENDAFKQFKAIIALQDATDGSRSRL
ncbi:hypothetical protein SBV1_620035 [Verrucomicrobia bacterium]|nr:hypothetical protein SBV1_620035 [Verrucomicrobiota bacterium]